MTRAETSARLERTGLVPVIRAPSAELALRAVRAVHDAGRAAVPGALTPTEIVTAWQAGADLVKVFPCSALGGPRYLRALRAPLPDIRLLPTGGITLDTAPDYLAAGAAALGVGADLVDLALLEREGDAALTRHAERWVKLVELARSTHHARPDPGQ